MKELLLKTGQICLVDDVDYPLLNKYTWYYQRNSNGNEYVGTMINNKKVYIHRLIMDARRGKVVDHINNNGLDNRRSNLRLCNQSSNLANSKARKGSSRFKGVSRFRGRWRAYIMLNNKQKSLGVYDYEIDAAKAYNKAARELFGEYSKLNNIEEIKKIINQKD